MDAALAAIRTGAFIAPPSDAVVGQFVKDVRLSKAPPGSPAEHLRTIIGVRDQEVFQDILVGAGENGIYQSLNRINFNTRNAKFILQIN
jgi:hypothetical protein